MNSHLLHLKIEDCHRPDHLHFAVPHGNGAGHFGVFPDGRLYLNSSLDETAHYALQVTVSDAFHSSSTTVIVRITHDTNSHAPAFTRAEYAFSIMENAPLATVVGQVDAVDLDGGLNGDVRYALRESGGLFTIDAISGIIRTGVVFDREKVAVDVYTLTVTATDRAAVKSNR